tara:strand:- start:1363 stop:2289 length:927 start_codon:yes stop_codon:yes gene_type:complete
MRKKYSFIDLCQNSDLASDVAIGPIDEFDYDVAILFSDILFPLDSLGLGLNYNPGPTFLNSLSKNTIGLNKPLEEIENDLKFQSEALIKTRKKLPKNKSLVGFVGGPWTLLSYGMGITKKSQIRNLHKEKTIEYILYEKLFPIIKNSISNQLKNKAEIVYIFDTSAKQLEKNYFIEKYIKFMKDNIFNAFKQKTAYFCKNNPILHENNINQRYNLAGIVYGQQDGFIKCMEANNQGFIQGNFNPISLTKPFENFKIDFDLFKNKLLDVKVKNRKGLICSLSHGVLPNTNEYNVKYFIEKIRKEFEESE